MPRRLLAAASVLFVITVGVNAGAQRQPSAPDLERRFTETVQPFVASYCAGCHGGPNPAAQLDLRRYASLSAVVADYSRWALVLEKLAAAQMPPPQARSQPPPEARQQVIEWIETVRRHEARRGAGDPGIVLARRLSNAEYNNTIRDLTGVDLRPAREFPVDPANPAGFDNSGESLAMSPALLAKYLQAAREVANNLVLKPGGIAFASHPMLVETDRDKYAVNQIIEFYKRYSVDYADYFEAAYWAKHRVATNRHPNLSPKYLATVLRTLDGTKEDIGPLAKLQAMWRALPNQPQAVRAGAEAMRDYVVQIRKKIEFKYIPIRVKGIGETAQPFLMWRNKQYATNRRNFNRAALRVEGEEAPIENASVQVRAPAGQCDAANNQSRAANTEAGSDADLQVPAGQRARYEAAFARFAAVFPDAFFVSKRGRYFPDNTRDTGRHLSAGFHNVMGYFRDDQPLYELMLDEKGQRELDAMWDELDVVALGLTRTFIQFFLNESGEARGLRREAEGPRPDKDITSEAVVNDVAEAYRNRIRQANDAGAMKAIDEHFAWSISPRSWTSPPVRTGARCRRRSVRISPVITDRCGTRVASIMPMRCAIRSSAC